MIERRKDIQRMCFDANINPPQQKLSQECLNFIQDTWDNDLKFAAPPTNLPTEDQKRLDELSTPERFEEASRRLSIKENNLKDLATQMSMAAQEKLRVGNNNKTIVTEEMKVFDERNKALNQEIVLARGEYQRLKDREHELEEQYPPRGDGEGKLLPDERRKPEEKEMHPKGVEDERKRFLVFLRNRAIIASFQETQGQMRIIDLPLINIKLFYTDFAPLLVLLGFFFLYWLRLNMEFARNILCSLYNDPDFSSADKAIRTIPAHFLLFWTGGSRRKSHWIFWGVLVMFILSGLILISTDIYDFFAKGPDHSIPINQQAGWSTYGWYAYGKLAVESALMVATGFVAYHARTILRDIRNLLMLIEWAPRALNPLLHRLFDNKQPKLLKGFNESSYDEYAGIYCLRISLMFAKELPDPNATNSIEEIFYARVDLWKSASNNAAYEDSTQTSRLFSKDELMRSFTEEEKRMRFFFYNILTNPKIEKELCYQFWDIARKRRENESAEELSDRSLSESSWMDECEKEFNKRRKDRKATTNEIIKRTETHGKLY